MHSETSATCASAATTPVGALYPGPDGETTLSVYVHLPFCREHCPYCDFMTVAADNPKSALRGAYIGWVRREVELAAARHPQLREFRLRSLYLGGGTPSLHAPDDLAPLFDVVRTVWGDFPADAEITLEANPGSLLLDRLDGYGALGVNRISLGVQTLDGDALRELGRAHDAADSRRALAALAAAPFLRSWSADLIFGFPRHTEARLAADMDELAAAGAPHLSIYGLTLHAGTAYEARHRRGDLPLPPEEDVLAMFRLARARAVALGFEAYEFSSFARPGHRSRHNAAYWSFAPVLPLGVSACGYLGGQRVENPRNLDRYGAAIAAGELPWTWEAPLAGRQRAGEVLMVALRRAEGIGWDWADRRCGADVRALYGEEFAAARARGWLDEEYLAAPAREGGLRLTPAGIEMSDEFFASLF